MSMKIKDVFFQTGNSYIQAHRRPMKAFSRGKCNMVKVNGHSEID